MPAQTLDVFGMSSITTTAAAGFDNNGGHRFALGSDTVTILPGSTSHVISVIDDTDGHFADDQGMAQRLDGDQILSGTIHAGGSVIASGYPVTLRSPRCSSSRWIGGHEKGRGAGCAAARRSGDEPAPREAERLWRPRDSSAVPWPNQRPRMRGSSASRRPSPR
ncbi:MAG: hypothetical protein ACX93U_19475 [Salipiger thiooxidans]|uniref:hypothetical protein n=1 Tax=Salipiger thiooxidans TaxID=282683 RepID=UPI001CFAB2D0|nr:hypothetical protein [Salipiger thiooxidans]